MSITTRPIPNQPLFVWPIYKTAISLRGHVQGKQGHHISVYTKVIAGTQVGATIPVARLSSFKSGTIRMYGYFLPTHWLLGATRYRFRLIVHIWNLMVSGIQLVAQIGSSSQKVAVIAEASSETHTIHMTHLTISGEEEAKVKLWFNIAHISRSLFVLAATTGTNVSKFLVGFRGVPANVAKTVKLSVYAIGTVIKPLKLAANVVTAKIDNTLKLLARIAADIMERVSRFSVSLTDGEIERVNRMSLDLAGLELAQIAKLSVAIRELDTEEIAKLSVAIQRNNVEEISKILVTIPIQFIGRLLKMSARLTPQEIIHVLSDLKMDVEGQWLEQSVRIKTDPESYIATRPVRVKSDVYSTTTTFTIKTQIGNYVSRAKGLVVQIMQFVGEGFMKFFTSTVKTTQTIYCPFLINSVERALPVHMATSMTHEEAHYLEAQILTLMGRKDIMFKPVALPPVHRAQCLVTVCNTSVQSYINVFLEDYKRLSGQVRISMCQGFVRRLIQWYLMGGRVSNEGWGNEVIFDLGEVNPVGPIPPSPSLNWGGGYVEDPFIGAGYASTGDGTGYESPEVTKWVQNVKMYWNGASEPFEGN